MPGGQKSRSAVGEIRDTTNPMFVTEMFTGMLRAMGQPLEIVRMQKNTRDEVLWKDTMIPWRHSPAWLFLRIHNPGERAAETTSSQPLTADRPPLLFPRICLVFASICSSRPRSSPTLLMHLPSQAYRRHSTTPPCLSLLGCSNCAPRPAFLASPEVPPVSPRIRRTATISLHRPIEGTWRQ
jgi:hypothetical protein